MAAGVFFKPGTDYGPCNEAASCGHTDCASTVEHVASTCRLCGEPIGYDTGFFVDDQPAMGAHGLTFTHSLCAYEDRDAER